MNSKQRNCAARSERRIERRLVKELKKARGYEQHRAIKYHEKGCQPEEAVHEKPRFTPENLARLIRCTGDKHYAHIIL